MKIKINNIWFIGVTIFILLYSMNFMGFSEFIPVLTIPIIFILVFHLKYTKLFLMTQVLLFLFLFTYCIISFYYNYYSINSLIVRFIYPQLFLVIGFLIANLDTRKNHRTFWLVYLLLAGSSIYGILSLLKSVNLYGNYENLVSILGGRYILDFWKGHLISATVFNSSISLGLSLLGLVFIKTPFKKIGSILIKLTFIILFIVSIYTSITIGNRTGVLIALISLLTVFSLKTKMNIKNMLNVLVTFLGIFLLKILFLDKDIIGIKEKWESSTVYARFKNSDINDDPRFEAWETILKEFNQNLLGGRQVDIGLSFVHNFWLDVYYDAGLIPLIALIVFTIFSLISFIMFLSTNTPLLYKALVMGILTAFLITFTVEPIIQGFIIYFTYFCFLLGIIQKKLMIESNQHTE